MSVLFTEANIKSLKIKNRFVRSATYEGMGTPDWGPSRRLAELYNELADGEVGLIITGGTFIERHNNFALPEGVPVPVAMDRDRCVDKWPEIVEEVHRRGSRIVLQVNHSGPRDNPFLRGEAPIASSDVLNKTGALVARTMTTGEIQEYIEKFAQACRRSKEAGFDGVQLHGGHGFLISSFISPHMNTRTDEYGGSTENRARFISEIAERARQLVGVDYPLMIKMNCDDFFPGGLVVNEAVRIAQIVEAAGIDCIEVTGGIPESVHYLRGLDRELARQPEKERKEAFFRTLGSAIKKAVDVPIILVGGIRTPGVMEKIIEEGVADFVSLSRPFIREPDLVKRWKAGDRSRASCISCNRCLKNVFAHTLRCHAEDSSEQDKT